MYSDVLAESVDSFLVGPDGEAHHLAARIYVDPGAQAELESALRHVIERDRLMGEHARIS